MYKFVFAGGMLFAAWVAAGGEEFRALLIKVEGKKLTFHKWVYDSAKKAVELRPDGKPKTVTRIPVWSEETMTLPLAAGAKIVRGKPKVDADNTITFEVGEAFERGLADPAFQKRVVKNNPEPIYSKGATVIITTDAANKEVVQIMGDLKTKNLKHSRFIDLRAAHCTSPQADLKSVSASFTVDGKGRKVYKEPYGDYLENLLTKLRSGATDLFLVDAQDLSEAIGRTQLAFVGGPFRDPKRKPAADAQPTYLVIYLGCQPAGDRPAVSISTIKAGGSHIKVWYKAEAARKEDDAKTVPYLYWVPLGDLRYGQYQLELYDTTRKLTVYTRTAIVEPLK